MSLTQLPMSPFFLRVVTSVHDKNNGNRMPQKKFMAAGILVFDFELFIGERFVRWPKVITVQTVASMTL